MSIEYPNGFSQPEMSRKPICGVLAIAICANVDYPVAHAACKRNMLSFSKRFRGATYPTQQLKALDELAVRYVQVLVQGWRLRDLIRERFEPGVLYMVTVPGHVVTVRDGFVCDQSGIHHWSVSKSAGRSVSRYLQIIGKGWGQAPVDPGYEALKAIEPISFKREVVMITDKELEDFCAAVQVKREAHYAASYNGRVDAGQMSFTRGGKYAKIIKDDGQRSVFCFVDLSNGDILKAAGWNAPAKRARGNIANGASQVGLYGANYLR